MKKVFFVSLVLVSIALVAFGGWRHSAWTGNSRDTENSITTLVGAKADSSTALYWPDTTVAFAYSKARLDSIEAVEAEVIQGAFTTLDLTDTLAGTFVAGGLVTVSNADTCNDDSSSLYVRSYSTSQIVIGRLVANPSAQKYNVHIIRTNNP